MSLIKILAGVVIAGGALVAGSYGISNYFYNRTMVRANAKREKTQKMSGTNWDTYIPHIRECKAKLAECPQEDWYITSKDGLKLHATYFPTEQALVTNPPKIVICFHGYTSEGLNDYSTLALFYKKHGYHLLLVDERAHGKSEGKYIGFGCLDRHDAKLWIE